MGSVIDYIECPNCTQEAYDDFYYKTGEEYVNCNSCGYHYSATIINRDKPLNELTDDDWKITEVKNPYGAFIVKCYDQVGYTCGSVDSEESFNQIKNQVITDSTLETLTLNRFIDGELKSEIIIDNGPKYDSAGFTDEDR